MPWPPSSRSSASRPCRTKPWPVLKRPTALQEATARAWATTSVVLSTENQVLAQRRLAVDLRARQLDTRLVLMKALVAAGRTTRPCCTPPPRTDLCTMKMTGARTALATRLLVTVAGLVGTYTSMRCAGSTP